MLKSVRARLFAVLATLGLNAGFFVVVTEEGCLVKPKAEVTQSDPASVVVPETDAGVEVMDQSPVESDVSTSD